MAWGDSRMFYDTAGSKWVLSHGQKDRVFEILERRLWDDPNKVIVIMLPTIGISYHIVCVCVILVDYF